MCVFYCVKRSWNFQRVPLRFRYARPSPASPNLCFKNVTSDNAADFIAPHGRRTAWAVYVCGNEREVPVITTAPYHKPLLSPSPRGGTFQRSAVCREVPEATLQERDFSTPKISGVNTSPALPTYVFWGEKKKTDPPVAPISLTVWIAHCTADYWFCFRPACVIAPESRLVIPAVKAINFMLAREHNLSVSHPTVWRNGSRHLHERVSYPKHKLCLY